ncbi:MAG: MopE-related protein, partial [Flavobacteriales bacterium]
MKAVFSFVRSTTGRALSFFNHGALVVVALLALHSAQAQYNFSDNATNYSGTWVNGQNFGTGYNAWAITSNGANAGTFIGNPASDGMGTTGIGTTAFGLFGHSSNTVNAVRYFGAGGTDVPMLIGDVFSFHWAMNWDAGGGFKGFDLREGNTLIFNVNNAGSSAITTTNGTADPNYGVTPMLVTLTRTSWTQYTFSMTSRSGGATYTTTINSPANINNINIYCGNQSDNSGNRNIYFNNFNFTKAAPYETNFDVTDPRVLEGTSNLTKTGAGALVLGGANTYSGNTSVANGILQLGAANVIPDGSNVTLNGGTLRSGATTGFSDTAGTLTLNATSTLALGTGAHTLTFANSSAVSWAGGYLFVTGWSGSFNGTAGTEGRLFVGNSAAGLSSDQLVKILFLNGGNYHTATILSTGEVVATGSVARWWGGSGNWNTSNWSVAPGGPYNQTWTSGQAAYFAVPGSTVTGMSTNVSAFVAFENVTINAFSTFTLGLGGGGISPVYVASGRVLNSGQTLSTAAGSGLIKNGPGVLLSGNGTLLSLPGGVTLNEGTLAWRGVNGYGNGTITVNGGVLSADNLSRSPNTTAIVANTNIRFGDAVNYAAGSANLTFGSATLNLGVGVTRTITIGQPAIYAINGPITGVGSNLVVNALSAGTLSLGGISTYGGSTTINSGTVRLSLGDDRLPVTTDVTLANTAGATLNLDGFNQTIASLTGGGTTGGNITLGAGTLTVNQSSSTTYAGVISGLGGLTKTGSGVLTLTHTANTLTGATTITGGELRLNPTANVTYASQVVLNGGTLSTTGIAASTTFTSSSTLNLSDNSVIDLGSNPHTLTFADCSGITWTGSSLVINGWTGTGGGVGTTGRIFFGNNAGTLLTSQLARISFTGFPGTPILLGTGELVPPVPPTTYTWNGSQSSVWANALNWTPNAVPGSGDIALIPTSGSYLNMLNLTSVVSVYSFIVQGNGTFTLGATGSLTITNTLTSTTTATPSLHCASTVTISAPSPQTIPAWNFGNLNASGGNRTLTATGTISICGTFTSGAGTYTNAGSTVNFNGTGAQTVNGINYNNLTISGNRGGAAITLASGTIGVAGTLNLTASNNTWSTTGNTVNFNGAGAQTVPAFANYNNLTISGNRGGNTVTLASGTIGVGGTFVPSATSVTYSSTGNTFDYTSASAQTIAGFDRYNNLSNSGNGNRTLADTPTIVIDGTYTPTTGVVSAGTSTIDFSSASAQNFPATNYYDVTNTGNGNRTWASSGVITINNTFAPGTGIHTIAGSTVTYNSTAASTFTLDSFTTTVANRQYNNLNLTGGAGTNWELAAGFNMGVAGNLNITTAGRLTVCNQTTANTLTIDGDLSVSGTGRVRVTASSGAGTLNVGGSYTSSSTDTNPLVVAGGAGQGIVNVTGNVTLNSASGGEHILQNAATNTSQAELNITGDLTISGNAALDLENVSSTSGSGFLSVGGNFSATSTRTADPGIIDFGTGGNIQNNRAVLLGNFTKSGTGQFYTTGTVAMNPSNFGFFFNKNGVQDFSYTGAVSNYTTYTVNSSSVLRLTSNFAMGTATDNPIAQFTVNGTYDMQTFTMSGMPTTSFSAFTLAGGATLITANANGINNGFGTSSLGGLSASTLKTYSTGASYVFNGSAAQNTQFPAAVTQMNSLTVSNTAGVTLDQAVTLSGTLSLANGRLTIGANNLTVSNNASGAITGTFGASNMVVTDGSGQLLRAVATGANTYIWPIGDASGDYTPVQLAFTANASAGNVGWRLTDAVHPNDGTATDYLTRYWISTQSSLTTYTYTPTFTYDVAGDVVGTAANILLNRWGGALPWTEYTSTTLISSPTISVSTPLNNTNGSLAATSEWTGRVNVPILTYTWDGSFSSDWDDAANWDLGMVPAVVTDLIVIPTSGLYTNALVIDGARTVDSFTVNGDGAFSMAAGSSLTVQSVWAYNSSGTSTFACTSSLTISGAVSQTIPALAYGNLNIAGGPRVLANAGTIGICGTFTPGIGVFTITGSTIDFNGTGAQTINAFSYLNLTISNDRSGATLTLASGNIFVSGVFSPTVTNYTPSFSGNTVSLTGAAGQVVPAFAYNNLTIGTGNLARTFAPGGVISIAGTFSAGTGVHTTTNSTVRFNGAADQTIPVIASTIANRSYHNLIIEGTGSFTPVRTWNGASGTTNGITGSMTINGGEFRQAPAAISGQVFVIEGNLTITNSSGRYAQHIGNFTSTQTNILGDLNLSAGRLEYNWVGNGAGTVNLSGNIIHTGGLISRLSASANNGTFNFNAPLASTRTISTSAGNVFSEVNPVILSGDRTVQLLNSVICQDGSFTVQSGATLDAGPNTLTINRTGGTRQFTTQSAAQLRTARDGGVAGTILLVGGATVSLNTGTYYSFTGTNQNSGFIAPTAVSQAARITWNGTGNLTMDAAVQVSEQLNMNTDGHIVLGGFNLTLASAATLSGPFSASRMIRADGSGFLIRSITAAGDGIPFTWPIGENTGTAEYSPVTIGSITNSGIAGNIGWRVSDAVHPDNGSALNYLSRYWTYSTNLSSYSWSNATFAYDASDVNGAEAAMLANTWNDPNNGWIEWASSSAAANILTITSGPSSSMIASGDDFTGRSGTPFYFRTVAEGPNTWDTPSSWEVSTDPNFVSPAAVPATFAPNAVNSAGITVRFGHTIEITASVSADDLLVETAALINISTGTLTIANGTAATDCSLQGFMAINPSTTLINASGAGFVADGGYLLHDGSLSNLGTMTFNDASTFQYDLNGGTLPTVIWGVGSTCLITGVTSTAPGGLGQNFYNLIFDNSQTQSIGLANAITGPIQNDLTVQGTGGFELRLASTQAVNLSVGGDVNITGGTLVMNGTSSAFTAPASNMLVGRDLNITGAGTFLVTNGFATGTNVPSVTIARDLNMSGTTGFRLLVARSTQTAAASATLTVGRHFTHNGTGTIRLSSGAGVGTINVAGDYTHSSGTLEVSGTGTGEIRFNGTSVQTFTGGGTVNSLVNYTVLTNAILDMGVSVALGNTFTTQTGSTLRMGSGGGIAASGASGNVQTTNRTFNSAANYVYKGSINQNTGTGLPSTLTGQLTIANTGGAGNNTVSLTTNNPTFSTINLNSGLFAIGTGQNINMAANGAINGNGGDFATGTTGGTITVPSAAAFTGNSNPYNVTCSSGVNFGAGTVTIQSGGTFQINAGGFVQTNAPFYGNGSNLRYFTNGNYDRFLEWSTSSGRGYPWNVQLSNNTNLIPHAGGGYANTVMQAGGNLTIDAGSNIFMDWNSVNMIEDLRIGGNLQLNGNLSGSGNAASDFFVGGNWTNDGASANFFPNGRSVTFNGTGAQVFSGTNPAMPAFFTVRVDKPSGALSHTVNMAVSSQLIFEATNAASISNTGAIELSVMSNATNAVQRLGTAGHVAGRLRRAIGAGTNTWFFPVGTAAYSPADLLLNGAGGTGTLLMRAVDGDHPSLASSILNGSRSVNRYWTITNSGVSFTTASPTFTYPVADLDGGTNTSNLLMGKWDAAWTYPTLGTITGSSVQATGITSFSDFVLAECRNPDPFAVNGGGSICPGGPGVAVGLAGSQAGVLYQLQLNNVNTGSPLAGTGSAISFGVQSGLGTYTVIATTVPGGCTSTMTGSVVINTFTTPTAVISGSPTACNGTATTVTVTVTGTGPFSGTINPGAIPFSGAGPVFNVSVTPNANTSYTAATLNDANCAANPIDLTGIATVTVLERPTAVISGSAAVCPGNNHTLTINVTGTGPYSGTINPGAIPFSGTGPVITLTVTPVSAITYTLASLLDANCTAQSGDLTGSAVITMDAPLTWYQDADFDGYHNGVTQLACTQPSGYYLLSSILGGGDCNDSNADINPGADEWCNGLDDNCDGFVDEFLPGSTYYIDTDGDGFGAGAPFTACAQPPGYVTNNLDCNNTNANIRPGATEICNGVDDDCDGIVDEGCGPINDFIENALVLPN